MPQPPPLDDSRLLAETFLAGLEHHAVLGSTNDRAKQLASQTGATSPDGLRLPLLVVADRQTAGRGRGTNRWWSAPGSLTVSLLVGPGSVPTRRGGPLVSLAAALAVIETVAPRLDGLPVGLDWPNDVVAIGRKLAGVLVEVPSSGCHVIGIGLNANNSAGHAPEEIRPRVATLLDLTGRPHDPTGLLVGILNHLERLLGELAREPESIGRRADALCLQKGRTLAVQFGRETITGRSAGIGPDGALLLHTPTGRRALYSGTLEM